MLKLVVVVLAVLATIEAVRPEKEYRDAYLSFVKTYKKAYSQSEFAHKYATFKANYDFVQQWNGNPENSHTVAINKFADLTVAEFSRMYLGTRATFDNVAYTPSRVGDNVTVDWRTKGAVTPIKDQGQCGSCWAFSAVGSTEAAHFFAHNELVSLSEQNLVDCSDAQGNQGCDGGLMTQAFDYIISNKGIDTEASYPYKAVDGTCAFTQANIGSTLVSYKNVAQGSEAGLVESINKGPTSVAIDASHSSFQLYSSGIYYEKACSATQLDHGVLAIGYGTSDAAKDNAYYIVKNSWGTSWGMNGFIEMSRNRNNNCGIATMATLPADQ